MAIRILFLLNNVIHIYLQADLCLTYLVVKYFGQATPSIATAGQVRHQHRNHQGRCKVASASHGSGIMCKGKTSLDVVDL